MINKIVEMNNLNGLKKILNLLIQFNSMEENEEKDEAEEELFDRDESKLIDLINKLSKDECILYLTKGDDEYHDNYDWLTDDEDIERVSQEGDSSEGGLNFPAIPVKDIKAFVAKDYKDISDESLKEIVKEAMLSIISFNDTEMLQEIIENTLGE
jgi:hypothetical protein